MPHFMTSSTRLKLLRAVPLKHTYIYIAPREGTFNITSNLLNLSVPDEGYSRKMLCALG